MEPTRTLDQARPPAQKLRLIVLGGIDNGRTLILERGTYRVGKDESCSLTLRDDSVSRQHLEVELVAEGVRVHDLSSKNGTYYNGARISEALVRPGALLRVGETELRLVVDQPESLEPSAADHFGLLIGGSLAMRRVYALLERVARTDTSVLIEGETGTGKELCAASIHAASQRASRPFVVCDLGGISESLIESELFGHRRGAFTGADRDRDGVFVAANRGTLFLDEIGELALPSQSRLLRALAQREIKPVGGHRFEAVDARIIAATHRDLPAEVEAGRFRQDLFHRMAVVRVCLPALRERKQDLPALARSLLADPSLTIAPEAEAILEEHDWPGNVRELRNVLERAVALRGTETRITPALLGLSAPAVDGRPPATFGAGEPFFTAKEKLIASWERAYLIGLLERAKGNVSLAARNGGIDRPYLHRLLKKHDLGEMP